MDVNQHLDQLTRSLALDPQEKSKIETSYKYIEGKIWEFYREELKSVGVFGSFERNTLLPRAIDEKSDVDIMVILKEGKLKTQTYLTQLRDFAATYYKGSERYQDFPTFAIDLNHIRFEIVPAYYDSVFLGSDELKIPGPKAEDVEWITTDPVEFRRKVEAKDKEEKGMFLPLIRIIKYWNVINNYPFSSYVIESHLLNKSDYWNCKTSKDYLMDAIDHMDETIGDDKQQSCIRALKQMRQRIIVLEKNAMTEYALIEIQKQFPHPI